MFVSIIHFRQVDKTSQNSMFNPQATLLEILDPEQNTTFKEPLRKSRRAGLGWGDDDFFRNPQWLGKQKDFGVMWKDELIAWSLFGNIRKPCWDMMLTSNSEGISPIMFSRFCFFETYRTQHQSWTYLPPWTTTAPGPLSEYTFWSAATSTVTPLRSAVQPVYIICEKNIEEICWHYPLVI